ncbi:MAG: endolytic transglycosylase MltG [Treponema sp.]|nr:endolytic transglycosylase MltG [Treponema sp.]
MPKIFKKLFGILASILGLTIFLVLIGFALILYFNSAPPLAENNEMSQNTVRFEVRKGESARSVGKRLSDTGVIRSLYFWQLLCRYENKTIKSGIYLIDLPASQISIYRLLESGKQMLFRVTVPEGFTIRKTASLMEEAEICSAEDFMNAVSETEILDFYKIPGKNMEGYLYPDTYFFPSDYPAEKVVKAMADNFFIRLADIDETAVLKNPDDLNRLVILASVIEREYRIAEEAPLMAGVFFNRLNIGRALQSCATIVYIITEIQDKPHPEFLTAKDLEIRDPYNTYLRPGLPPGPICSPGAIALRSAIFPEKNNFMYFRLTDQDSGRHYFSRTLDDHIRAGALYLKGN